MSIAGGHKGCGKTVELLHIKRQLESTGNFTVFHWQAEDSIDLAGVDFPDLALGLVSALAHDMKSRFGIQLKPGYFRSVATRLKEYLSSEVQIDEADLDAGMVKLAATIKQSPSVRAKVRAALDPDSGSLLDAVNDVIGQAKTQLSQKGKSANLVILADDLDKGGWDKHPTAGMTTGEFLFDKRHLQLRGFHCHLVYVLPLDLAYGRIAGTLQNRYGDIPLIPMVEVRKRPPSDAEHSKGMSILQKVVEKRMHHAGIHNESEAFAPGVMKHLIRASGGEPRQLMHLIRQSMNYGGLPIQQAAADLAETSARKTLRRTMTTEDWQIVKEVAETGVLPRDAGREDRIRSLLLNRQVLQYSNGDEWFAPSPLLGEPPAG